MSREIRQTINRLSCAAFARVSFQAISVPILAIFTIPFWVVPESRAIASDIFMIGALGTWLLSFPLGKIVADNAP
jgi:hypothetical protein